jgi:HEAT repeat protein
MATAAPLLSRTLLATALIVLMNGGAAAQDPQQPGTPNPDGEVVGGPPPPPKTPAQLKEDAWTMLSSAEQDLKHPEVRTQALAALGLLDDNPRSLKLIKSAMQDQDVDVRTTAVLAAGQTKAPAITSDLRRMLDDKEPQVAFSAALALWKMDDRSGEDILMAVVDGERRASATLLNGTEHDMDRTLHSPAELAKIGVTEGAGLLLGPFGFGITAYEYIHKNGGSSARVTAIEALAQEKTDPIRKELLGALNDKDLGVRAAAAKALDSYHLPEVSAAIAKLFDDPKQPVRLTAAAAYLISTNASPASPKPNARRAIRHK